MTHKSRKRMVLSVTLLLLACSIFAGKEQVTAQRQAHFRTEWPAQATSVDEGNTKSQTQKIKIALLLDVSNSMDGLIDQAKSQLWTIVNELAAAKSADGRPEVLIALYEYGNSRLSPTNGYIRQVSPLTNDLDRISESLFALTTSGGE